MNICFIPGAASEGEVKNFRSLCSWITSAGHRAWVHENATAIAAQPQVVVSLHGYVSDDRLKSLGITSSPKRVCYILGLTNSPYYAKSDSPLPIGSATWSEGHEFFSDEIWGYGDTNIIMASETIYRMVPLPIDVEVVPASTHTGPISVCQVFSGNWWKNTLAYKPVAQAMGVQFNLISGLPQSEAWAEMGKHSLFFGTMNYGNLGKSELEAMAAGLAVTAWVKPSVKAMYETLGANFPVIAVTRTNVKTILKALKKNDVATVAAASRTWMMANYSHTKLANAWITRLNALLAG